MSPDSLVLYTIVTRVDLKDRFGIKPPVYCMPCLCFITQACPFLPLHLLQSPALTQSHPTAYWDILIAFHTYPTGLNKKYTQIMRDTQSYRAFESLIRNINTGSIHVPVVKYCPCIKPR